MFFAYRAFYILTESTRNHVQKAIEIKEKAIIRNRYDSIQHSSTDTIRERNTNNQDDIK